MAEWKKEIRKLAKDFYISKTEIQRIFKKVEQMCSKREMPKYYGNNLSEFLYDNAQREVMKLI